jgi:hypothetical protein
VQVGRRAAAVVAGASAAEQLRDPAREHPLPERAHP